MKIEFYLAKENDIAFLKQMLYEAVFWRNPANRMSYEKAFELSEVRKALEAFGLRSGDVGIIAKQKNEPIGAVWMRHWSKKDQVRGYIDENIPVLAIAVHEKYRHQGIGKLLMNEITTYASKNHINNISLCVSKDNKAMELYKACEFVVETDIGDSFTMIKHIDQIKS